MLNPYAAGKTTYFGGLPNATSGTVDPTGYIDRENNKSQRRSGLAAVALARQKGAATQGTISVPAGQASKKVLNTSGLYISPTGRIGRLQE